jgi:hypothetical protein
VPGTLASSDDLRVRPTLPAVDEDSEEELDDDATVSPLGAGFSDSMPLPMETSTRCLFAASVSGTASSAQARASKVSIGESRLLIEKKEKEGRRGA